FKRSQFKEKERQIAHLNLATLSNQFRPHFMLNALNGVAAQLDGKPKAEMIINHIGESVDLLFKASKSNAFTHSFDNEWRLTQNMIELQRLLYLPDLIVTVTGLELIPPDLKLPTGIIQIPVENALLHGLRHKIKGDQRLELHFSETLSDYTIVITDNGIGRKAADKLNNFKKNGSGIHTISQMIKLLNQIEKRKLSFEINDNNPEGTNVTIKATK
ncbi:MAG: histidine kinase, partial [Fluviicola sp.]|nr:histidine kinase [Fluviicola sp.]